MKKAAYEFEFRVPFGDIDWMGHVNNAKYLTYFETARSELMFKAFGLGKREKWLDVIIARAEVDFKSPAKWNDLLVVKVRPEAIGKSSWTYEYEIEQKDKAQSKVVAKGKTVQVAYDYKSRKSIPIPRRIRAVLVRQIEETKGE
jgi:acyl-CoA thioester hydrolase